MRDVSRKFNSLRTACAEAVLHLAPATLTLIRDGKVPKGDPLPVAKVAAIQAAKETSRIIPYCHPVPVDFVGVEFTLGEETIVARVEVKAIYKTGVEMEALTGASVAALTLYDMLKMLDTSLEITGVRLLAKHGGKSDFDQTLDWKPRTAVLVISDSVSAGKKEDISGKLILERIEVEGFKVADYLVIPDDPDRIKSALIEYADKQKLDLVLTTGGTGISPRDSTPEATKEILEQRLDGIAETARSFGQQRTPFSMLSRAKAGARGSTLIINLPGSKKGVEESLDAITPGLKHALRMLRGEGHDA